MCGRELFRITSYNVCYTKLLRPLNLLAIIFGGVGLKNKNKGLAIAGLVIGIVGIVLSIIFGISLISDSATEYSYDYNFFNY